MTFFKCTQISFFRIAALAFFIACTFSSMAFAESKEGQLSKTVEITISSFNDIYKMEPFARMATYLEQLRASVANHMLIFAGDLFSSVPSRHFKGAQMIDLVNRLKPTAATLGNQEFAYGLGVLRKRMQEARFPFLLTNVLEPGKDNSFGSALPYLITEIQGVRIGILGLLTPQTERIAAPGPGVRFIDHSLAAKKTAQHLETEGVDYIIAISHCEDEEDFALARSVPEIDLIIGGHDHFSLISEIPNKKTGKSTWLIQATSDGYNMGRIDLRFSLHDASAKNRRYTSTIELGLVTMTDAIPEDEEISKTIDDYNKQLSPILKQPVFELLNSEDARPETIQTRESGLANLITDIFREAMQTDLAFLNSGNIRALKPLVPGTFTVEDIEGFLPFDNPLTKAEVYGSQINAAFEHALSRLGTTNQQFPQISGAKIVYDPSRPAGSRVVAVYINGRPLDLTAKYTIAIDTFLLDNGDGFDFRGANELLPRHEAVAKAPLVIQSLSGKKVALKTEGRILTIDEEMQRQAKPAISNPCNLH